MPTSAHDDDEVQEMYEKIEEPTHTLGLSEPACTLTKIIRSLTMFTLSTLFVQVIATSLRLSDPPSSQL